MRTEKDKSQFDWLSRNLVWVLFAIMAAAALLAGAAVLIFRAYIGGEIVSSEVSQWGQAGDFFGGILNPVFGFLTIVALVLTLLLQSKELKMSREELELSRTELAKSAEALNNQNKAIEQQSFEQTFFAWLSTYREILGEVRNKEGESGRNALRAFWYADLSAENMDGEYSLMRFSTSVDVLPLARACGTTGKYSFSEMTPEDYPVISLGAMVGWAQLYGQQENQLDSLFRVLYRLLRWIDLLPSERLSQEQKWLYVSIVRSQLSWIEMVYLFYNGYTERGRKFRPIIEKYALFDNLNFESDRVIAIVKDSPNSTPYAPTAYSSEAARAVLNLAKVPSS